MTPEVTFNKIEQFAINKALLYWHITECRMIKSREEIELLRYTNKISSEAHKEVMRKIRPGMSEFQCERLAKKERVNSEHPTQSQRDECG